MRRREAKATVRVGFFGGTFDPPHNGHLAVARAAVECFGLHEVLLAPTGRQPLKRALPTASFENRLAMVELLCSGVAGLRASDVDGPEPDGLPNYTIDTLQRLRSRSGKNEELFVLAGADAFLGLRQWREPERLLAEAEWIVVSRPGFSLESITSLQLSEAQRARVHLLSDVSVPVSATELRERLQCGESCEGLMPEPVLEYIHARGLYGTAA